MFLLWPLDLIILGSTMVIIYHLWTAMFPRPPRLTATQVAQLRADRTRVALLTATTLGACWVASTLGRC